MIPYLPHPPPARPAAKRSRGNGRAVCGRAAVVRTGRRLEQLGSLLVSLRALLFLVLALLLFLVLALLFLLRLLRLLRLLLVLALPLLRGARQGRGWLKSDMCRVEQRHCTFSFFSFLRRSSSLELELELLSLSLELSLGIGSRASRAFGERRVGNPKRKHTSRRLSCVKKMSSPTRKTLQVVGGGSVSRLSQRNISGISTTASDNPLKRFKRAPWTTGPFSEKGPGTVSGRVTAAVFQHSAREYFSTARDDAGRGCISRPASVAAQRTTRTPCHQCPAPRRPWGNAVHQSGGC